MSMELQYTKAVIVVCSEVWAAAPCWAVVVLQVGMRGH